jgi:hypothetical protein
MENHAVIVGNCLGRLPRSLSARMQGALVTRAGRISLLLVITLASILVHGYDMGTDDAAIYAPGIEKAAPFPLPVWL